MREWETLEEGWWRKLKESGTGVVIWHSRGHVERPDYYCASIFVNGVKVSECNETTLEEAMREGELALQERLERAPQEVVNDTFSI